MASCPICQNKLQTDFGNEVCTKCGATVFVESDDIVHIQNLAALDAALNELSEKESTELKPAESSNEFEMENDPIFGTEKLNDPVNEIMEDELLNKDFNESSVQTNSSTEMDVIDELNSNVQDSIFDNEDNNTPAVLNASREKEASVTAEDFLSEMQLLGDMASEKFKESNYFFDIEITGIDSKDVRDEILDHLFDSRLGLKENNIDKKIKNGFLVLKDVSAVKTQVIVQRLSHLPCEISWKIKEAHELGAIQAEVEIEDASLDVESLNANEFEDIEEI